MPSTIPLLRKTTVKRRILIPFLACLAAALVASAAGPPVAVTAAQAATCASYSNQAAAQRAADTRDADGDGVYCESLPCPCAKGSTGGGGSTTVRPAPRPTSCTKPKGIVSIGFSAMKYPNIRRHAL